MRVHRPAYRMGDYLIRDDRTGFRRYRSQCRKEWNGLIVAKEEWEQRQAQDFVRGKIDPQTVPDPRPGWTSDTATFHAAGSVTVDDF